MFFLKNDMRREEYWRWWLRSCHIFQIYGKKGGGWWCSGQVLNLKKQRIGFSFILVLMEKDNGEAKLFYIQGFLALHSWRSMGSNVIPDETNTHLNEVTLIPTCRSEWFFDYNFHLRVFCLRLSLLLQCHEELPVTVSLPGSITLQGSIDMDAETRHDTSSHVYYFQGSHSCG